MFQLSKYVHQINLNTYSKKRKLNLIYGKYHESFTYSLTTLFQLRSQL